MLTFRLQLCQYENPRTMCKNLINIRATKHSPPPKRLAKSTQSQPASSGCRVTLQRNASAYESRRTPLVKEVRQGEHTLNKYQYFSLQTPLHASRIQKEKSLSPKFVKFTQIHRKLTISLLTKQSFVTSVLSSAIEYRMAV